MTQAMLEGFSHKATHKRTLVIVINIGKAFDATPRHKIINKIYNNNMHNDSKRCLANCLSDRKAHVNFNDIPSKIRPFRDGVP